LVFRIDATKEDTSLGRLLNDSLHPNCVAKLIESADGVPHICFFACCYICVGEELGYNYCHGGDYPWRKVCVLCL
jgi:SET domain-containing protein